MERKEAAVIGLNILIKHHAFLFASPLRELFEMLIKEGAFDYSIISLQSIRDFADKLDEAIDRERFPHELAEESLDIWRAYGRKASRKEEFEKEKGEISTYTGITQEEIMEFAHYIASN
jgi:hypothetical protein